jgi:hypothetical protein
VEEPPPVQELPRLHLRVEDLCRQQIVAQPDESRDCSALRALSLHRRLGSVRWIEKPEVTLDERQPHERHEVARQLAKAGPDVPAFLEPAEAALHGALAPIGTAVEPEVVIVLHLDASLQDPRFDAAPGEAGLDPEETIALVAGGLGQPALAAQW